MPISLLALLVNYRQANGLSIIGTEGDAGLRRGAPRQQQAIILTPWAFVGWR